MALKDAKIATRLPAQDLQRARVWYAEKLDLHPSEERDGGLLYKIGHAEFALFESAGESDGSFIQMAFTVSDVRAEMAELRARGVVFETYDGERACWFRDSEGNMLGMGQPTRKSVSS
jgi:catechol 2,3-dioxygenase-like lactoylglutathione lyase family enzyme